MKTAISLAALGALLAAFSAVAQDAQQVPRMFKGMAKGQWRVEILENTQIKSIQKTPVMTICTDNLAKQGQTPAAHKDTKCRNRVVKDGADEAVFEMTCPERTVTTTMKRQSPTVIVAEIKSTGDKDKKAAPLNMKMRYTNLGACKEGQSTISYDKNSEQCKKIQANAAKMDPAKTCAREKDPQQRAQCEKMMQNQIAQAKAMCS